MPRRRRRTQRNARPEVIVEHFHTIDNIAFLLQIPITRIDSQIEYRDVNKPWPRNRNDKPMFAIRLEDIDELPTWRVPHSSFLQYCRDHGYEPEVLRINPPNQKP